MYTQTSSVTLQRPPLLPGTTHEDLVEEHFRLADQPVISFVTVAEHLHHFARLQSCTPNHAPGGQGQTAVAVSL
eukprot:COSAG06_NODE_1580_length_9031_cov_6.088894_7_plen_74_part_00